MALEDMIDKCSEAGVTHFELHDLLEGIDGDRVALHWELYRGDPVKWVGVVMPWNIDFHWLGFGPHPRKCLRVLPFSITLWPTWRVGIYTGGERCGYQMSERPTLEAGLRAALGNFLCEGRREGEVCPHYVCEFHDTEYCEAD